MSYLCLRFSYISSEKELQPTYNFFWLVQFISYINPQRNLNRKGLDGSLTLFYLNQAFNALVGRIERGEINTGIRSVFKLAKALGVKAKNLFNF